MRIADETIGAVRDAVDIVDVVGDYVRLKKRGSNFVGLCPFHSEKTPSFNVNPGLEIYKCFGCGEGGDVFSFISAIDNLTFPEAVRAVAERCGIIIPESEEESEEGSAREAIYQALQFAARFFHDSLAEGTASEHARDYLEKRQISAEMVKRFGIGYALDSWDGLLEAATKASISEDVLHQAGLILPRRDGSGYYDRYRDRLIFPILSHVGRVGLRGASPGRRRRPAQIHKLPGDRSLSQGQCLVRTIPRQECYPGEGGGRSGGGVHRHRGSP